jgi:hypothetical protein
MKTKIFFLFAFLVGLISFNSCNLDNESSYTPEIIFVQLPFNQHGDTLKAFITDAGSFKLDTINVGDTVSFFLYLTGYQNNLKTFYLKQSADSSTRIVYSSIATMDSIFTVSSNYANGQFLFNPNISGLYFPFKYVALKPSNEASLTFSVVSDAVFDNAPGSNATSLVMKTPIRTTPKP